MKYYLILLLGLSLMANAQDKIVFEYDSAGNQIKRSLCVNCLPSVGRNEQVKEVTAIVEEDLQKFFPEDAISYYPNPVKEELFLKWELANDNIVSSLEVYNLNGQLLQKIIQSGRDNTQVIPFRSYPSGTYILVLQYSNEKQKSIKIIKQ
jgi:hypothetical protein